MASSYLNLSNESELIRSAFSVEYKMNLEESKNPKLKKAKSETINQCYKKYQNKNSKILEKETLETMKNEEIKEKLRIKLGKDGLKKFIEKYKILSYINLICIELKQNLFCYFYFNHFI